MSLRKPQREFKQKIGNIIDGDPARASYVHVTPGGGKSALPVIAGDLILAGLADKICWVVPRLTLGYQAESNFMDPFFRNMLNHDLTIRSSTNEVNPCRGQNGFTTTYQALGVDEYKTVLQEIHRKRYILVLDEFHHCEQGGVWTKALDPIVEQAAFTVFMTGSLARGDNKPIAWMNYSQGLPCLNDPIIYTRTDALQEQAILPLTFFLHDGHIEYEKNGRKESGKLSEMINVGDAIYTALETGFAEDLLREGLNHWKAYKYDHPRSKLIVVAADIKSAKRFKKWLSERGYISEIATSEDGPEAQKAIKKFKYGRVDVLVAVAMIYEGFDCPQATHIICLTHIRSIPWIEQMAARAVRIDREAGPYESQRGFIFAPDDALFRVTVDSIEKEQIAAAVFQEDERKRKGEKPEGESAPRKPDVIPLGSKVTDAREVMLGDAGPSRILTVSDQENDYRQKINNHVLEYCRRFNRIPEYVNGEIKDHFQKGRAEMTLRELKACYEYVKYTYPVRDEQGKSRGRTYKIPTQAVLWG